LLDLALSSDTSNTVIRARELVRTRIDPLQLISQLANLIMDILSGKCELDGSEIKTGFRNRYTCKCFCRPYLCFTMQTPYCFYLISVCPNLVIFFITAEADLQKLSHALRILSESEKQLRISKNQTTWFTAALLQLSSVEYSSPDTNTTKLCTRAASVRGGLDFLFSCFFYSHLP